ncbi:T9SS type A sorting domain-containing protein [Maribellus comscasis]|uniref:T9SS type A sorting domain-containing protein n=1 Tax=Maribellus comscasis TaxID=2681766 RepID=A0A6I6JM30_9BACT|nr:T9SS type A sorting domain-containing protein [Maribellus comscasis]QGY42269.1 T9SS type A sorting domain-containing protein [Maribellus comscasis]
MNIYNINGSSVFRQQTGNIKTTVDFSALPGIYTILLTDEAGQIMLNQKIVKQ